MDYEGTLRQSAKNNQGIVDSAVYAKISHVALERMEPEEGGADQVVHLFT